MFNENSLRAVAAAQRGDCVLPLYESYCFSNLPGTFLRALTGEERGRTLPADIFGDFPQRYERIVFILVDALGWHFFQRHLEKFPFFQTALRDGVVSKLTSQFPSTTTGHVSTIHTGLTVAESGIYEWYQYEPQVDAVIAPLLFSFAGDVRRDTLLKHGILPGSIFPNVNIYATLGASGVESHLLQPMDYACSSFNQAVCKGAHVLPYDSLRSALEQIRALLSQDGGRKYIFFYWADIDTMCHSHGPLSRMAEGAAGCFFDRLQRELWETSVGKSNTLLVVSADHGQVPCRPEATVYLDVKFPEIRKYLKTGYKGKPLVPAGSPRDFFLHAKEESLGELRRILSDLLVCRADVKETRELVEDGWFGTREPSKAFLSRAGNLAILPHRDQCVFWHASGKFRNGFLGIHGGASAEEMEIPLFVMPF